MAAEQITVIEQIISLIRQTKGELDGVKSSIVEISKEARSAKGSFEFNTPKEVNSRIRQTAQFTEQVNAQLKEQDRLERALISQIAKKEIAVESTNRALVKHRYETQQINKAVKEESVLRSKLSTFYQKQNVILNQLTRRRQDLLLKQQLGIKLDKKEAAELVKLTRAQDRLDKAIKATDASVGRHQRNVGNYGKALGGLGISLKGILSAFGLTTGLALFAGLIKDAFANIKQFDSGLLNVSKTTGLAGDELKDLGDEIINLSRSLKTVGTEQLLEYATVAGQLGIKGSENILAFTEALAKLETASDISGEEGGASIARLLTLVDGGVDNVADFGDEIVKLGNNFAATENEILDNATAIAQNTGLYKLARQQVLAYATATKAVGIESEITGTTIGKTLGLIENALRTGNGLSAITELTGKNVDELQRLFKEDAGALFTELLKGLNKVDAAGGSVNEKLESLGITAARDQRVIGTLATAGFETLESAIRDVTDAAGSLNEEFATASTKMENQVSRLTIAWDNLILSIESGDGAFSRYILWWLENAAGSLDRMSVILDGNTSMWGKAKIAINGYTKVLSYVNPFLESGKGLFREYADNVLKANNNLEDATKEIQKQQEEFIKYNQTLDETVNSIGPFTKAQQDIIDNQKEINGLFVGGTNSNGGPLGTTIADLDQQIKDLNEQIQQADINDIKHIRTLQAKKKALEDLKNAALGITKATQDQQKAIEGSVGHYEDLISQLKKTRDNTATTTLEYQAQTREIEELEKKLNKLKSAYESVGKVAAQSFMEVYKLTKLQQDALDDLHDSAKKTTNAMAEAWKRIQQLAEDAKMREFDQQQTNLDFARDSLNQMDQLAQTFNDNELNRIDKREERMLAYYDKLLENENLSTEQQEALAQERDRKQQELQDKREKAEKRGFLISQAFALGEVAINLAKAITAINATAYTLPPIAAQAYQAANIPLVIASAALQTSIIAAQTIPKFAKGKDEADRYEGPMIWGEKRPEVRVSKEGKIDMATKPTFGYTRPGDTIFPSMDAFTQSIALQLSHQHDNLTPMQQSGLTGEIEKLLSKIQRPVINNNVQALDYNKLANAIMNNSKAHSI